MCLLELLTHFHWDLHNDWMAHLAILQVGERGYEEGCGEYSDNHHALILTYTHNQSNCSILCDNPWGLKWSDIISIYY